MDTPPGPGVGALALLAEPSPIWPEVFAHILCDDLRPTIGTIGARC